MKSQRLRSLAIVLGFVTVLSGLQFAPAPPAHAVAGSDFDPGYLISDERFFDQNAMDEAGIQNFLDGEVLTCRAGYTCLKDYAETTFTRAAVAPGHCDQYSGETNERASRIIAKVSQACHISPQTLLVLLEKETGLVTDTWPTAGEYRKATGYGCPDTSSCDAAFYGFYNQVYKAAWQFRQYTNFPDRQFRIGNVAIGYHPNAGCGSSTVLIRNQATADLYNYTPYQPNNAALGNLYGTGDTCSSYGNRNFWRIFSDWFGQTVVPPLSPVGNLEIATASLDSATFRGWTFDPETSAPIAVHLYINDQWGGAFRADTPRSDISLAYPSYGASHGFSFTVPITAGAGAFRACLYAINVGAGANQLLGCRTLTTPTGPPVGSLDNATLSGNTVSLSGWALDPDAAASIDTHVYVNGRWAGAFPAATLRNDVGRAYPGYGNNHGFAMDLNLAVGTSEVCVYGINIGGGANKVIGCRTVSTASGPPIGNVESSSAAVGMAHIGGWALDPDSPDPIAVHVYVDGRWGGAFTANGERTDVARSYPGYGSGHGFSADVAVPGGSSQVCVYGINLMSGYNSLIRCTTVTSASGAPFGNFEPPSIASGHVTLQGWVIDPDTVAPIVVHVYVNGQWGGAFTGDAGRADVGRAYPTFGTAHGFSIPIVLPLGQNQVCVFAINVGPGFNPQLGCRTVAG
ncbi:hypothetical protein [Cryobacterium zhongshanensis]|uniref:Hemagglutinin n=1 Tax=Cryobacterium zhongshanensis TaxID=2928153 RepID=A0AA41UFX1_9MICO|nr:hypothetical protein [Cryobacterium zhongshanensis]MCI4658400.1 hypothetical protein [Cryobacterium zhongshanensis]